MKKVVYLFYGGIEMAQYLLLAENVIFKNDTLTCINIYNKLSTVAMPAEFRFDLAIMCGPDWEIGEHNLTVKVKASNGKEVQLGELKVNIPSKDFVYNAFANDLKLMMDYSVSNLTFIVCDNEKEIISRKYPVVSMLVPQKKDSASMVSESADDKAAKKKKEKAAV